MNVAGGTTPSPAEDADAADFSLSPVANDEQEAPNSAQLNSEGKHTPGRDGRAWDASGRPTRPIARERSHLTRRRTWTT